MAIFVDATYTFFVTEALTCCPVVIVAKLKNCPVPSPGKKFTTHKK